MAQSISSLQARRRIKEVQLVGTYHSSEEQEEVPFLQVLHQPGQLPCWTWIFPLQLPSLRLQHPQGCSEAFLELDSLLLKIH